MSDLIPKEIIFKLASAPFGEMYIISTSEYNYIGVGKGDDSLTVLVEQRSTGTRAYVTVMIPELSST